MAQPNTYLTGNHYPVTITDTYFGTYTETVTAPTHADAVRSAAYIYQQADNLAVSTTPVDEPITFVEPEEPDPAPSVTGLIAARAVNAHPWLSTTYPGPDDTESAITPANPAEHYDTPTGHIEGRILWQVRPNGNVIYAGTIAYEGAWSVEREFLLTVDPTRPLAWVDLTRCISELVNTLARLAHEDVDPGPNPFEGWLTRSFR